LKEKKNIKARDIIKNVLIGIVLILSIYYSLKGIDLVQLWNYIKTANIWFIIIPVPIMVLSHWFRATRWKVILEPIKKDVKMRNLFATVMIGYAVNNIIPRGGEIVRPWVYAREEKISFSGTLATIVLERLLDLFMLVLLFGIVFIYFSDKIIAVMPTSINYENIAMIILLAAVVLIICFYPPFFEFLIRILIKPISEKLYHRALDIFNKFGQGFAVIKNPKKYLNLLFQSALIWFLYALPLYIMFYAFSFATHGLDFLDSVLLLVSSGIAFTIAPTPGSVGVFHIVVKLILVSFYGIQPEQALAFATVNHGVGYLVQVLLGGYYIIKDGIGKNIFSVSFKKVQEGTGPQNFTQ